MNQFNVITLFPQMIEQALSYGVTGQAIKRSVLTVSCLNPRQFTQDVHQTVDDRPFGGGDGMVMMAEPLKKAVEDLKTKQTAGRVVYLSPHGKLWDDQRAREWARESVPLTLVCGRYGGVDQRFINKYVDEEISIGDYVLSGAELAAAVVIDSVARHLPGVLGNSESATNESFSEGSLEAPQFTRPREFEGLMVPEVLLSGDHQLITRWRKNLGLLRTQQLRPDLIDQAQSLTAATEWALKLSDEELEVTGLSRAWVMQLAQKLGVNS